MSYQEQFHNRITPDIRIFSNTHRKLYETRTFRADNHLKAASSSQFSCTPEFRFVVCKQMADISDFGARYFLLMRLILKNAVRIYHNRHFLGCKNSPAITE